MDELQLKYNSLDAVSKKEALDYIDFLATKMVQPKKRAVYKKDLLSVSTWSDSDIKAIADAGASIQFDADKW